MSTFDEFQRQVAALELGDSELVDVVLARRPSTPAEVVAAALDAVSERGGST